MTSAPNPNAEFESLVAEITSWPSVRVLKSQVGDALVFRLGPAELGHLHPDGTLDIQLPRPLRDVVLNEELASVNPDVPTAGWVRITLEPDTDQSGAIALLRLSFLAQVAMRKRTRVGRGEFRDLDLEAEVANLNLPCDVQSIFRDRWPTAY